MSLEAIITQRIYRHNELHCEFAKGTADEMNRMISDDFQGWLYRPGDEGLQSFDANGIRSGNSQAARYYEGKSVRFRVSGITVLPQGLDQATASYQITYQQGDAMIRALVLEVWRKESDGEWRVVRWHEEKGALNA